MNLYLPQSPSEVSRDTHEFSGLKLVSFGPHVEAQVLDATEEDDKEEGESETRRKLKRPLGAGDRARAAPPET